LAFFSLSRSAHGGQLARIVDSDLGGGRKQHMAKQPLGPHFPAPSSPAARAEQEISGTSKEGSAVKTAVLSLVVAVPHRLDEQAFSALLNTIRSVELIGVETCLNEVVRKCASNAVDLAILHVNFPDRTAFETGRILLETRRARRVAFLDDRLALWRAQLALRISGAFYLTRDEDLEQFCFDIKRELVGGPRAGVVGSSSAFIRDESELNQYDVHGLLSLSLKQRVILERIVKGQTLKQIAEALKLAESTVDNHKSRIMKKLNVNRLSQLMHLAFEVGMIG
jgi:two-component system, NarL family, response regulator NreC